MKNLAHWPLNNITHSDQHGLGAGNCLEKLTMKW